MIRKNGYGFSHYVVVSRLASYKNCLRGVDVGKYSSLLSRSEIFYQYFLFSSTYIQVVLRRSSK